MNMNREKEACWKKTPDLTFWPVLGVTEWEEAAKYQVKCQVRRKYKIDLSCNFIPQSYDLS